MSTKTLVDRMREPWEKMPGAVVTKINRILKERRDAVDLIGALMAENDHGADKFRSALEVERQIAKAKDAEISALRKALAQQVAK